MICVYCTHFRSKPEQTSSQIVWYFCTISQLKWLGWPFVDNVSRSVCPYLLIIWALSTCVWPAFVLFAGRTNRLLTTPLTGPVCRGYILSWLLAGFMDCYLYWWSIEPQHKICNPQPTTFHSSLHLWHWASGVPRQCTITSHWISRMRFNRPRHPSLSYVPLTRALSALSTTVARMRDFQRHGKCFLGRSLFKAPGWDERI